MAIRTFGTSAVDWEQRVDFERLRTQRLARLTARLEASELGALLSFDMANTRYMAATHIGARAGISTLRGAFHPDAGIARELAAKVAAELRERGLADAPVGIDVAEMPVLAALKAEGIETVDGQQVFLEARRTKTADEITLLAQACSMVDAAYDKLYEFLRPGVRENECVGLVAKVLYDLGSEYVEGVNAISGERCSPHPHVFSDRILRPGDPA